MNKNCFLRRFVCIFSLMVFAFLCSFLLLGTRHLFSGDETRVAGITMEMLFSSEKLVQHLNGDPFLEYPPLFNWIGAICLYLFSNAEFAVRFPSSLSLFLSVILIFLFARRMGYTLRKSYAAAVIFPMFFTVFKYGRYCTVDMLLCFSIFLAWYGSFGIVQDVKLNYKPILNCLLFVAGLCAGFFTKGIIGIMLACFPLQFFCLQQLIYDRKNAVKILIFYSICFLFSLIPPAIYYSTVYLHSGYEAFYSMLVVNNLHRFNGNQGDHAEHLFYYVLRFYELFLPWLFFVIVGLIIAIRRSVKNNEYRTFFLTCIFVFPAIVLTISSQKRLVYLLPLYVPAALLAIDGLSYIRYFMKKKLGKLVYEKFTNILFCFISLVIVAGSVFFFKDSISLSAASQLMVQMAVIVRFFRPFIYGRIISTVLLMFALVIIYSLTDGFLMAKFGKAKNLKRFFEKVAVLQKKGEVVFLWNVQERTQGAANFYLRRNLPEREQDFQVSKKEIWIVRDRKLSDNLQDHHHIFVVKPNESGQNFMKEYDEENVNNNGMDTKK